MPIDPSASPVPRAEHFAHDADIGVRGIGSSFDSAFEQAALALTAIVTELRTVRAEKRIAITCAAPSDALLFVDWLNAVIYHMAVDHMLFARYRVVIEGGRLHGEAWGEPVDRMRHRPAVEPKGATYTALKVERQSDGTCVAQCVVDV